VQEAGKNLFSDQELKLPAVLVDADGLNALAAIPDWAEKFKSPAVLTPHPAEMARLAGLTTREIQADRIGNARPYAQKSNKVIVLKGA